MTPYGWVVFCLFLCCFACCVQDTSLFCSCKIQVLEMLQIGMSTRSQRERSSVKSNRHTGNGHQSGQVVMVVITESLGLPRAYHAASFLRLEIHAYECI
ncbi:hypothetical protein B0J18DRAFT_436779 [Chaetomium sp. MPI-SDFR-AT-0129]|nr:hypothetical protein B0J18DRAFT_436779 [Chaetomium sp. MPI-SDFR-AT-0129]